jgi:hypothetical protein
MGPDRSFFARFASFTIALPVAAAALCFPYDRALAVQVTRGPYLQLATPGSITIRWRTDLPATSQVRYGDAPDALSTGRHGHHPHHRALGDSHGSRSRSALLLRDRKRRRGAGGRRPPRTRSATAPDAGDPHANPVVGDRRLRHRRTRTPRRCATRSSPMLAESRRTCGSCWGTTPTRVAPTANTRRRCSTCTRSSSRTPCCGRRAGTTIHRTTTSASSRCRRRGRRAAYRPEPSPTTRSTTERCISSASIRGERPLADGSDGDLAPCRSGGHRCRLGHRLLASSALQQGIARLGQPIGQRRAA